MIRTHVLECHLPKDKADPLNRASGQVYTGMVVHHWRVYRKKGIWLSEKAATRWSDRRTDAARHAHTIDAAQQGFYKAIKTARAVRKIDPTAHFPIGARSSAPLSGRTRPSRSMATSFA